MNLELTALKGIGEKTAGALGRLGILCVEDLVLYFPREYETYEMPRQLYALEIGKVQTVEGVLTKSPTINRFHGMIIVNASISDMTGHLQLSWFNAPFIRSSLIPGQPYVFRGRVYEKNGRLLMSQPKIYKKEDYQERFEGRLLPVYPLTKGISNQLLIKTIAQAITQMTEDPAEDYLDETFRMHEELQEETEALKRIHFPRSQSELEQARNRIVFDEFFMFLLAGSMLRNHSEKETSSFRLRPDFRMVQFIADLPYELTVKQQEAYKQISHDMCSGKVMNRLVEGDVGSGKTIVAVLAMFSVCLGGYQAAMMAPTEVLAMQHFETIQKLLGEKNLPISPILLTGSMSTSEKKEAYRKILAKEANLIIGTHALFQEKAVYADLALVVTDEQHRFGVAQRQALMQKGRTPHTLVMSATPIPRTLALILYSDLDTSVIDVLPSGRKPIKNCVITGEGRNKAYKFIYDEIKKGRQAYVICPAVEEEEEEDKEPAADLENVEQYTEKLKKIFPAEVRIQSLHGRMKSAEKDRIMSAMKAGEIDILVSTTVIEVGVDVPNATVIMIENAERFGLAQLHQLRGRVGRGSEQSYCIMVNTSNTEKAAKRLDILNHSNDGFHIAEEDLRLRGPGELFGARQSGELVFHLADIYTDAAILKKAKAAVTALLEEDPELKDKKHLQLSTKLDNYIKSGYTV